MDKKEMLDSLRNTFESLLDDLELDDTEIIETSVSLQPELADVTNFIAHVHPPYH